MKNKSIGFCHGLWGEAVAREYLKKNRYQILEVNVRPLKRDKRLELDIVAIDTKSDTLVFVEVKQHAYRVEGLPTRLRSVDRRKRNNIRIAANNWRIKQRFGGNYRFDVIQVYGTPELGLSEIYHTKNVRLFSEEARYVNW